LSPTGTRQEGPGLIGKVRIQTLLDCLAGQLQNLLANRDLQGLEVQIFHCLAPQQGLNLLHQVGAQQIGEEVFF